MNIIVLRVLKNSPAEKAGLQDGDVIVAFNGEQITSTRKLTRMIAEVAPDHKADITVVRNGSEMQIPVVMGKRDPRYLIRSGGLNFPSVPGILQMPNTPVIPPDFRDERVVVWNLSKRRTIGVQVTSLTKQLADYFGISEGKGLLINSVNANSPAERAGLQAGDVIIAVNENKISNNLRTIICCQINF